MLKLEKKFFFTASLSLAHLSFGASAGIFSGSRAFEPAAWASAPIPSALKADLATRKSRSFENILKTWEQKYGTSAVGPLLSLARDPKLEDTDRYVALMGAVKLGGPQAAPLIAPFLKDTSWMMRAAALRALAALENPSVGAQILPLLRDPSLVVRTEAVDAIERLKPAGAVPALLSTLEAKENYHSGKAQWVPARAIRALVALNAKEVAPKLAPLLSHEKDPALQKTVIEALEKLTGRKTQARAPLSEQARSWRESLGTPAS